MNNTSVYPKLKNSISLKKGTNYNLGQLEIKRISILNSKAFKKNRPDQKMQAQSCIAKRKSALTLKLARAHAQVCHFQIQII